MGKRKKSTRKPAPTVRRKNPKAFDCPFCDTDKGISVRMRRGAGLAVLNCKSCPQVHFETQITGAAAEIDVYAQWYQMLIGTEQ